MTTSAAENESQMIANESGGLAADFVNDSAMMIAYERHLETLREDALFKDPLAHALAASKGEALSNTFGTYADAFNFQGWQDFHKTWTVVRTKFIDDKIAELAASGRFKQLVNLGAGFDTRACRLECFKAFEKGSFEVDMTKNNTARRTVFRDILRDPVSHCAIHLVDLDFLDSCKTLATELTSQTSAFDAGQPSIFLAEGLVQYLGEGRLKLFKDVSEVAAPGSVFILQFLDATGTPHAASGTGISPEEVISANSGWSDFAFCKFGEEKLNFGRYKEGFEPNDLFSFAVFVKQ
jgi:methyltransferase (TIGR00027 family)